MGRRFGSSDPSHTAWRIRQIAGPDLALRYLEGRRAAVDPQAPAPPPAPAPAPAMPDNPMRALFEQLRGEMSKAMPALSAHERTQVGGLFGRIEPLVTVNRTPPDFGGLLSTGSSLQRLIRQGEHLSRNAGLDAPAEAVSSRTDRVLAALTELKLALLRQGLHPHAGSAAFGAATELFTRLGQLSKSWQDAPGDADAFARVERDQARPLALEVFEFLRASHAHEVRPVFPGPVPPMDASTLFFSGAPATLAVLQRAAQRIGLQVDPLAPPGADFALQRWRSLRRSALAVFDLGSAKPQVFYELGLALATGVQLLLLAPLDHVLPFDVAQTVTRYTTLQELEAQLPQALDDAGYRVQINAPRSVNSRDALWNQEILRVSAAIGGDVLCGRWMPQPVSATPRWFAVMPFRAGPDARWQLMARRLQRLKPGLAQVRGDRAQGQEIVASIWDELCRASHVSADLTELNPNVCLEVGIAHALGRPTLLIGQAATARRLDAELPGLAKWRCHEYGRGQSRSFNAVVDQFFGVV
jgi:hypothetical protein